jgi:hypothetical protein
VVRGKDEARARPDIDHEVILRTSSLSRVADNQIAHANGSADVRESPFETAGSRRAELPHRSFLILAEGAQRFGRKGKFQQNPL